MADSVQTEELLRPLLEPWQGKLDGLVLGCTHYPFARNVIEKLLPGTVLFDGGDGTARETRRRLQEADLLANPLQEGSVTLECSGNTEQFRSLAQRLLDR